MSNKKIDEMDEKKLATAKDTLTENSVDEEVLDVIEQDNDEEEAVVESANYDDEILEIIQSDLSPEDLREQLDNYHENDIAGVMEQVDEDTRKHLYEVLDLEMVSDIFTYYEDASEYLDELDKEMAADVLEQMDADDAIDVLEDVDKEVREELISLMDEESKEDIQLISSYDEDEIGSRMTTNYVVIHKSCTVKQAMRALIKQAEENDNINTIYVEDDEEKYYGAIDLKDLITARDYTDLNDIIVTSYPYLMAREKVSDCIERLKDYAEDSIPVLNEEDQIIGVITSEDIVEAIDEEMGDDYAKLAGLTEEQEANESLWESMKKRMPWLILLLFLGMGVSAVTGMFEGLISKFALIVSFQSVILGMSGNVGTQSLAVTIRMLMDEEISSKEKVVHVLKEMRIGLMNGLVLGILGFGFIGVYVWLIKGKEFLYAMAIAGCVGISFMVAMCISSLVGAIVPIIFDKLKVDPAVASGPLISTINDLVAVITYYGLSGIILLQVLNLVG